MSANPYGVHALLLVYGSDRAEIARQLREEADRIEHGAGDYITQGADGARIVRARDTSDRSASEEAGVCRMHAVYADGEGWTPSEPIALFADPETARRFAAGDPLWDDGEGPPGGDLGVLRADVMLSVWNSFDPDPHGRE